MSENLHGFDPLATAPEGGTEDLQRMLRESQRRDILNILRSYTGTFDLFSEAIQNALDAVEQRLGESPQGFKPKIWIKIDVRNSSVTIVDNGVGMTPDQLRYFLRPNVSFKQDAQLRGHKGVGATFLAYGYSAFTVQSKTTHGSVAVTLTSGRTWAESSSGNIPRPTFSAVQFDVPELASEPSGTAVSVSIGQHRDERPNLGWIGITEPDVWMKLLRLKTPAGGVYLRTPPFTSEFFLTIADSVGTPKHGHYETLSAEFYLPHDFSVCQRHKDLTEVRAQADKLGLTKNELASKMPATFRNLDCLWEIWTKKQLLDPDGAFKTDFSDEQKNLVSLHDIHVYGCFVRSSTVWDSFQKDELRVRPQLKVIQGGMQLASDHMVQGDLFTIPLTTAAGYQANSFILVHFTNGNPDMGRKVFQPELKEIADIISRRAVAELRRYQSLLKPDTGSQGGNPGKALEEWKDDQREWARTNPLLVEIEGNPLAMISEPREEQDVIALFHELVGVGLIQGIKFYGTGYNTRYDALVRYDYSDGQRYEPEKCPFGVDPRFVPSQSAALVLEYKYSLDGLIRDFEKEEKNPKEISLVVCWDVGTEHRKAYTLTSLLVGQEGGTREFFGATHAAFIGSGPSTKIFEVVSLRDVIDYLTEPQATIARHQATFK